MKKALPFIIAAILGLIGMSIWGVGFLSFFRSFQMTGGISILAPGVTTLNITNAGDYTIWNQTSGIVNGQFKTFPQQLPAEMTITVMKKTDGTKIPLQTTMNSSMEINGTHRVSVASLNFPTPGQYQFEVTGLADQRAIYLDRSFFDSNLVHAFFNSMLAGLMGFVFIVAAVGTGIYGLVRLVVQKPSPAPR